MLFSLNARGPPAGDERIFIKFGGKAICMGTNYCQIRRNVLRARRLVIRGTAAAGSGHPGGSFSMAEILGCLFHGHLRFDPADPGWEGRDRLVLSKGHAAPGLYSAMAVAGYFPESEIGTLRALGSRLQGHPDLKCPGVEFCGGSLGTGLSYSVGLALAGKMDSKSHRVYAIIGDGESDEGQVWEAAMTAAKYGLDNLTVFLDRNFIQQDSYTEAVMPLDEGLGPQDDPSRMWKEPSRWRTGDKWRSFGWNVIEIDGHRIEQVSAAIVRARASDGDGGTPTIIISRTIKGKSVEHMEDNPLWHGKAPSADTVPIIHQELESQFAVAPSITAGDMSDLAGEVRRCADGRADYIHLDVMDGRFVPNTTFGHEKVRELRPLTDIPFDTHLMIEEPGKHVRDYVDAGSDIVTVHAEATDEAGFGEIHDLLRQHQVGVGLALNPGTNLPGWARRFVPTLDQIIVMSVVPGRSGQAYMESAHAKTSALASELAGLGFSGLIEADGGVNPSNAGAVFADGARVLVGGGAIVGQPDVRAAIRELRAAVLASRRRLLLAKAHALGGADLARRWVDLHVVGQKRERLEAIAREAGYL